MEQNQLPNGNNGSPRPTYRWLDDFRLKHGKVSRGVIEALIPGAILVIAPWVTIQLILIDSGSILPEISDALRSSLSDLSTTLFIYGILVSIFGFFRGLYPKGTVSRLLFSGIEASSLCVYFYVLFYASTFPDILRQIDVQLDLPLFFLSSLVIPLLIAIMAIGELVDERGNWRKSLGLQAKSRPLDPGSRWLDLNPRIGKIGEGARLSLIAYVCFVFLPLILLTSISIILEKNSFQNNQGLADAFKDVLNAIIPFSILIVLLSFPRGFYPKGTFARALFGAIVVVLILLLVDAAFLSGGLEGAFLDSGVIIDLNPVLLVILLYASLGFVVVAAELLDNRRKWMKEVGRKVEPWTKDDSYSLVMDFRIRYAAFVEGAKKGKGVFRRYIIYPTLIVVIIMAALRYLDDPTYEASLNELQKLIGVALLFGFLVVLAQFIRASYPRGSVSRLTFGLAAVVFIVIWILEFVGGIVDVIKVTIEAVEGSSDISTIINPYLNYILIPFILWAGFLVLWYILQYFSHRREWVVKRAKFVD
jgi:hypothetical protein